MIKKILGLFVVAIFCGLTYNVEAIVVDKRPITVGVSYFQQNEITKAMINGAKKAAKNLKAQLFLRDGRGEKDVQIAQIHDLVAQNINCLVVIFNEEQINSNITASGNEKGIPIITVDGNIIDKQVAFDTAYKAVEEAWHKVKAKPIAPAFYSGY